jgi:hypothetical protein
MGVSGFRGIRNRLSGVGSCGLTAGWSGAVARRRSVRRLDRLAREKIWLVETRIRVRAEARAETECVESGSCGAPVWLRW